jgi:hypothetical protein
MTAVKLPAIFSGIRSKVDRSYSLTFGTQELSGADAAVLLKMNQSTCWLLVAPTEDAIDKATVPDYKPDVGTNQKSQAQRIRSVIFLIWTQRGRPGTDFEEYYRFQTEKIIDALKLSLDDGEER